MTLVVVTFDAPSQWPHLSLYCIQGALDRHDGQNSDRIGQHRLDFQRNAFKRERISKVVLGTKNSSRNDKGKAFIVKSQSLSGSICFALLGSSPSIYCRQDGKKPLGATKQHSASLFSAYRFNWQSVWIIIIQSVSWISSLSSRAFSRSQSSGPISSFIHL